MTGCPNRHGRLFERREARLAALDTLPRGLWLGSLTNAIGSIEPRLWGVHALREALRAGDIANRPYPGWPEPSLAAAIDRALRDLALQPLCRAQPDLADQVVASLLWHLDRIVDDVDRGIEFDQAAMKALESFADEWRERHGLIDEIVTIFGDSGDVLRSTDWGRLRGVLRSEGWNDIVRSHRLLEKMRELAALIRRLGRSESADGERDATQVARRDERASESRLRELVTHVPEMPGATCGVYRSGRVARMLPAETMLLTHARMRLVWHARHAERALLTYEDDERMRQWIRDPADTPQPVQEHRPVLRTEAGPMLVCVDTSGSMQGGAEVVAKAVVLEAMRTAQAQKRACRVFAFGGPGEIVDLELSLDVSGLERLTGFLAQGFHGGTDICGPLERVLARLTEHRWRLADLLIASDGEFGATAELAAAISAAKAELGLRVEGVLIGDRETIGMLELADDIFWVRDWRRYGGSPPDSPVPSKSLTATYFPGALRGSQRSPPIDGNDAARSVLAGRVGESG